MEHNLEWKTKVLIKVIYKTLSEIIIFSSLGINISCCKYRFSQVLTVVLGSLAGWENGVGLTPR